MGTVHVKISQKNGLHEKGDAGARSEGVRLCQGACGELKSCYGPGVEKSNI